MRYGYRHNIYMGSTNTYAQELLKDIRDEFATIPGWSVHDDQTSLGNSGYVVWRVDTSEGAGNEVYVRIFCQGTDHFGVETWEGWDNSSHVGTGASIGAGRIEHDNNVHERISWRWCGDQDHVYFVIGPPTNIFTPTYLGLTTKLRPNYDAPRGWIMCTWYYVSDHSTTDQDGVSYSDDTKTPVLRGQDGTNNKRSRVCRTNPNWESYLLGPGGPDGPYFSVADPNIRRASLYFYPMILVEADTGLNPQSGFGPRGILKSVLIHSDSQYASYGNNQRMKIGSRDYIVYKTSMSYNDTYNRRNSWGQRFGDTDAEMAWAMPISDWYVPCYIEGA